MLKAAYNNGYLNGLKRFKLSNALMGYGSAAPTAPAPASMPSAAAAQVAPVGRTPSPVAPIAPQANRSMVL